VSVSEIRVKHEDGRITLRLVEDGEVTFSVNKNWEPEEGKWYHIETGGEGGITITPQEDDAASSAASR
jgi:hypothetical protein